MKEIVISLILLIFVVKNAAAEGPDPAGCSLQPDRLLRLQCYDAMFGRQPDAVPDISATDGEEQAASETSPSGTMRIVSQLQSAEDFADGKIRVAVFNADTGSRADIQTLTEGKEIYPAAGEMTDADYKAFRTKYNVWFAMDSMKEIGLDMPVLFGCDHNITTLRFLLPDPVSVTILPVQVYWGRELQDSTTSVQTAMRIIDKGWTIEAPRGVESIRLLGQIASGGGMMQVSYSYGQDNKSAFYSTDQLIHALAILARHCEWK